MKEKKVIPCLDCDLSSGRINLVKGIEFKNVRAVGNPIEKAKEYCKQGADELVVLDINATVEGRKTRVEAVRKIASVCTVPLTVGGGIKSAEEAKELIDADASKVGINSAAVKRPELIRELSKELGKWAVVSAIDGKKAGKGWNVFINAGTKDSGLDVIEWARNAESFGAGSILLTSIDRDGTEKGYDIPLIKAVSDAVKIPVIASGGAGTLEDMYSILTEGNASAVLGASVFHYGKFTVRQVKEYLKEKGIEVFL